MKPFQSFQTLKREQDMMLEQTSRKLSMVAVSVEEAIIWTLMISSRCSLHKVVWEVEASAVVLSAIEAATLATLMEATLLIPLDDTVIKYRHLSH